MKTCSHQNAGEHIITTANKYSAKDTDKSNKDLRKNDR
jgi:hypothetical protein